MSLNYCRSCGKSSEDGLKTSINGEISGESYKKIIERNIKKKMVMNGNLSEKICDLCQSQIHVIANLTNRWKSNETNLSLPSSKVANFQHPVSIPRKRGAPRKIKAEPEERQFFVYEKTPENSNVEKAKNKSKVKKFFIRKLLEINF